MNFIYKIIQDFKFKLIEFELVLYQNSRKSCMKKRLSRPETCVAQKRIVGHLR